MTVSHDAPAAQPETRFVRYLSFDQEIPFENARDALRGLAGLLVDCAPDGVKIEHVGRLVEMIADKFDALKIGDHVPIDAPARGLEM